jgi:tellurite resistance protein
VGFISYVKLVGAVDGFARVLFYVALFTALLLVALYKKFYRLKFYLSWWAYSFPTAALTIAGILMFRQTSLPFFAGFAWLMLAILAAIIGVLLVRTLIEAGRGEICVEE